MSAHPETREGIVLGGLALLARAFVSRPRNAVIFARNLVPVVGIYALGWSPRVTVFSYWLDGLCLLALLLAAFCVQIAQESLRESPARALPGVVGAAFFVFFVAFGMVGIPYWMAFGALDLGVPLYDVLHDRALAIGIGAAMLANVVGAFQRGGPMRLSMDELKARWQADAHNLIARAIAMAMIVHWGLQSVMVPLIALMLTAMEVWPTMVDDARGLARPAPLPAPPR